LVLPTYLCVSYNSRYYNMLFLFVIFFQQYNFLINTVLGGGFLGAAPVIIVIIPNLVTKYKNVIHDHNSNFPITNL